jgi:hypothetical protein
MSNSGYIVPDYRNLLKCLELSMSHLSNLNRFICNQRICSPRSLVPLDQPLHLGYNDEVHLFARVYTNLFN